MSLNSEHVMLRAQVILSARISNNITLSTNRFLLDLIKPSWLV